MGAYGQFQSRGGKQSPFSYTTVWCANNLFSRYQIKGENVPGPSLTGDAAKIEDEVDDFGDEDDEDEDDMEEVS